jgi:hypothetical protein
LQEDPLFCGVGARFFHLIKAVELEKGVEVDGGRGNGGKFCRPIGPVFPVKCVFEGFEMGIGCEPRVFLEKGLIAGCFCQGGKCFGEVGAEEGEFLLEYFIAANVLRKRKIVGDAESGEAEINGVEGAGREGIVGAWIGARVIEREELDAVEF